MNSDFQIEFQPKQRAFLWLVKNSDKTWLGMGGARGGAKSGGGRRIVLLRAAENPGTRHLILRRLSKQLVDNHITPLLREFPALERHYIKSDKTLRLPNKAELVFGYAEHPAKDLQGDIYDYQGSEWMTVFVDEAGQMNEEELRFIKTCCRWPGKKAKMILTMNPGGRGHNFLKRIFIDKKFEQHENPEDFAFIRSYGWDNVEWVKDYLPSKGMTVDQYYSRMTDEERKVCFLEHSDYGHNLNSLKGKMRLAYLDGDWDAFAGQFFDVWDAEEVTTGIPEIQSWWPRWVSIDWGYEHNAAVYWHTQADNLTITYRELVGQHISPPELGQTIAKMSEGEEIDDIYLSPDAFELSRRKWISKDTIADQINGALKAAGLTWAVRADHDRIGGAQLMHELLSAGLWKIDPSCRRLLECIPDMQRDEDNREDVAKVDCAEDGSGGDDPYDSARYGLKSRLKTPRPPVELRVKDRIEQYAAARHMKVEDMEPTSRAMMVRRAIHLERPKPRPSRFRPGRPYHGA